MKVFYAHGKRYSEAEVTLLPDRMERATYPCSRRKKVGFTIRSSFRLSTEAHGVR